MREICTYGLEGGVAHPGHPYPDLSGRGLCPDPPDQGSLREEESDKREGEGEGVSAEESMEGTDEQSVLDPAASEG
jgi:hypothetical protein